ncbi:glycoside hydrolase [Apiospora phragmitis]|uniref:Mannosyl-oligosaccharide glucosidase n=1 Tax=Apiospora phragmitis TaxID=2905665 RepID=A0ABR1UIC7_9PEZI
MASHNQLTATLLSFFLCLLLGIGCTGFAHAQDGDESILNSEVTRLNNQSLLWGPYRPNLYFGLRPRIPKSLMAGLMWAKVDNFQDVQNNFRWTCEQNEGMAGYGWDEYDTRKGGVQTIHDAGNKIDLTTSLVKIPGGAHGGSWAVRVKGEPREDAPEDLETTIIFYANTEGLGQTLEVSGENENTGFSGDVTLKGSSPGLGDYKLVVTKGTGNHPTSNHPLSAERGGDKTLVNSMTVPEEHAWQGKALVFTQLKKTVDMIVERFGAENAPPPWQVYQVDHDPAEGNVQMIQKTFEGPFEFDILFSSASAGKDVTSEDLTREIKSTTESFNEKFSEVFTLQAPFKDEKYRKLGSSMLSNLAGGIGYFHGQHLVDRSYSPEYEEENEGFGEETEAARARKQERLEGPYELFTSIPSRPFFPRGFLWDEGFHLLPIADWDMDLALEIVKSWYDLMDDDGWIAREQILGTEARSKVPEAFQVQYPHYANPPTLFFIVEKFLHKLQKEANGTQGAKKETLATQGIKLESAHIENSSLSLGLKYLQELYPLLRRQFYWFKKTQYGDIRSYDREAHSSREAYRWRGRTVSHVLTSGLDDYPRPQPPHPGELHVDLMSWVGLMAKTLSMVAKAIGEVDDAKDYDTVLDNIQHNLVDLHWSEKEGCFCDATIDDFEDHQLVCHKGYISLFPFLVGLLKPDDPHLGKTLDLLGNEEELFSPHGIRSLSKSSPLYGTEENYWRSPVWMPLNYLAVVQLQHVALQNGPYQSKAADLYTRLRKNLVETVYQSWEETGFAWEQYNPETGKGQRTQHFTGWTSLVVKIMAMPDLGDVASPPSSSPAPGPEKSSDHHAEKSGEDHEGHDEL